MFNAQTFFDRAGVASTVVQYLRRDAISHEDPCSRRVMYIPPGSVKLSVVSQTVRSGCGGDGSIRAIHVELR